MKHFHANLEGWKVWCNALKEAFSNINCCFLTCEKRFLKPFTYRTENKSFLSNFFFYFFSVAVKFRIKQRKCVLFSSFLINIFSAQKEKAKKNGIRSMRHNKLIRIRTKQIIRKAFNILLQIFFPPLSSYNIENLLCCYFRCS